MTDNVYCIVKIIEKDEGIIAAVQFEIKLFDFFFYQYNQLTGYIHTIEMHWTDSVFIRKHYLVIRNIFETPTSAF